MKSKLVKEALLKYSLGVILVGLLVFVPAGTLFYWNGILLMGILFLPMAMAGFILMKTNPTLLKKRLHSKESQMTQKKVIGASTLMFVLAFVSAGISYRYQFWMLPQGVSILFSIVFLLGYALFGLVLIQNEYVSRTIEVQENQKVVDTGLYGMVRHPMYSATLLMFPSMGLVLGSIISTLILCLYFFIIIQRIENEEEVLEQGLEGYKEYKERVKYKIIPWIY